MFLVKRDPLETADPQFGGGKNRLGRQKSDFGIKVRSRSREASSAVVVDDASTPVTSQDADKNVRAAWRGEGETIEFDYATNPERRG